MHEPPHELLDDDEEHGLLQLELGQFTMAHEEEQSLLLVLHDDSQLLACTIGDTDANKRLSARYFFVIKESLLFHKGWKRIKILSFRFYQFLQFRVNSFL